MTTQTAFTPAEQTRMATLATELNLPLEKVAEVVAFAKANPLENFMTEEDEAAPDLTHWTSPGARDWFAQPQPNRHAQARRVAKQARAEAGNIITLPRRVGGGDIA